jgi:hypothetical protein
MTRFVAVACLLASAVPASAKTFVLPHFLEKSGFTSNTQYTFDTSLFMTYSAGLAGTAPGAGAHLDLWLFDEQGNPLGNNGVTVCGPCAFDLSAATRKASIRFESEMLKHGPLDTPVKQGYAIATVSNDQANLGLTASLFNSHTSAFDLTSLTLAPWEVETQGTRVLLAPHLFEPSGSIVNQTYSFDTTIYATYVGGQAGLPGGTGATVDFYWYADDGTLLKNNGNNVCGPCSYNLGAGARKATIKLENLVLAQGAFDTGVKTGFGVLVVGGGDPDGVALTGMTVNAHANAFDLAFAALDLVPVDASSLVAAPAEPGFVRTLSAQPNPSREGIAFTFDLARAGDVTFAVYDALGRKVRTLSSGTRAAGAQRAAWDGRDDGGARVAPGVYFGRLLSGAGELASKVVVLP